ncbi:MAG: phage shock protein PspC [Candidatus Taylorbacteria bacterium]|nr:phage shock protein PspC [Candidatus Taylorbacteria bacterium]
MNKVITINLGGRSYSVEESGYNLLKVYLDNASIKLESNPDKEEIIKDFNIAIAEKCDAYLSSTKNVILTSEIEKIIKDMGPVEAEASDATSNKKSEDSTESKRHKKLYLLPDSGVIFGVCSGLAAYFEIDVTLVRIVFIALTVLTHGAWIAVYFVMWMLVPKADTPEEKEEAWGAIRTTAQDLMQRARTGYEHFKNSDQSKHWKKQMKQERRQWQKRWHMNQNKSAFYELTQSIIGMAWLVLIVYIAWFGYEHVAPLRDLFDVIGNALGKGIEYLTEWIRVQSGQ